MTTSSRDAALALMTAQRPLFDTGIEAPNPFGTAAWMQLFVEHFADDRAMQPVIVEAQSEGQAALLTLARDPRRPSHLTTLCNYYSSLHSPLYAGARDRGAAAQALVRALRRDVPGVATVQLAPLAADAIDTQALRAAFADQGWYARDYFCFGNWYLPCEGLAFADYMKARDSQVYNTWSRKSKKFKVDGSGEARLQIVTRPEDVPAAMDAYEAVYVKSWKQAEPYPRFIREWAAVCARNGWLRLGIAWIGDVPVAAQLWFTLDRHAYIFKLAYDEAYSKWSAGTVLTAHLMRESLDVDGVVEIDYLTGDDPYKKSWMSHRRERIGLLACNLRSPRGLATAARERAAAAVRRWRPRRDAAPSIHDGMTR